jgi:hypothetical protein
MFHLHPMASVSIVPVLDTEQRAVALPMAISETRGHNEGDDVMSVRREKTYLEAVNETQQ